MNLYDIAYSVGLGFSAPVWAWFPAARQKIRRARAERWGDVTPYSGDAPGILLHAVSVGELNATPSLIQQLTARHPNLRFCITTTTDTGSARAVELYGKDPRITPARFPVDFSGPVNRLLDRQRPAVAVLMELEVWPNFMLAAKRHGIPVVVINGRITASSFRAYQRTAKLTGRMFKRLAMVCAQDQTYADRFIALGVPRERVRITGTMKFDTATIADRVEGAAELAAAVGLCPGQEKIWVCGSTGPGEESLILSAYAELRKQFPALRLAIVPRHPQRFDEVAAIIQSAGFPPVRRSRSVSGVAAAGNPGSTTPATESPIILGDTMGELRKFYSLADVVFVGRTLLDLGPRQHGSDMIEPAALAKPVIVGRYTANFAEVMQRFRAADAMREIRRADELAPAVAEILAANSPLGPRAQQVARDSQGATATNAEVVAALLPPPAGGRAG
ncbi:MAG TPA: 3-deoxy-D-manno-octulosonic acid transferase [Tepidisphaeraceae bacterium]|jgi:3-deoxy-D-manno-octulosonic-acid transferase|nr:3-deoxy-D-manno-octulosonic acid transferase [Tepidisphaeraceae bacterium]